MIEVINITGEDMLCITSKDKGGYERRPIMAYSQVRHEVLVFAGFASIRPDELQRFSRKMNNFHKNCRGRIKQQEQ